MALLRNCTVALGLVAALALGTPPVATGDDDVEYAVKAAFLYNFARFTEWPEQCAHEPVVFGVLGDDPFDEILDHALEDKSIGNRQAVVRRFTSARDVPSCSVVFVSSSEKARLPGIVASLGDKVALTVAEWDGFTNDGGMIRFYLEENRVRFEINLDSVEDSNLVLSSQLLRLARVVRTPGKAEP